MKKIAALFAVSMIFAAPASAQNMMMKPYLGFDLQRISVDYNDNYDAGSGVILDGNTMFEDTLDGFNIHVGSRFHKHFGLELGYFRSREESRSISAGSTVGPGTVALTNFSTDVLIQGVTLDALGYLPVGEAGRFELIGTAGLAWSKAEAEFTVPGVGAAESDESEIGFRIGAGAQVNLTEKLNIRGLVRYQTADFEDVVDELWFYTLGLNYSF